MAPKSLSVTAFKTYHAIPLLASSSSSGNLKVVQRNRGESSDLGAKIVNGERKLMHTGEGAALLRCFGQRNNRLVAPSLHS
jgi:hypothetical protein